MCELPESSADLPVRGILLLAGGLGALGLAAFLVVKLGWLLVVILIVLAMIAVAMRQAGAASVVWWPSGGHAAKAPAKPPAPASEPEPVRDEWR